jgi:rfaE bifunctional protein kinase chain/domain
MNKDKPQKFPKVLVVGDTMLDTWQYFESYRLSPEADIPIVKKTFETRAVGGAGNALRHLKYLSDSNHSLIAAVGLDPQGSILEKVALEHSLDIDWVRIERSTTLKKRVFVDGAPIFREDIEDSSEVGIFVESTILNRIEMKIPNYDVVLVSDYAKGLLTKRLIVGILELAVKYKKPLVVDPGVDRLHLYAGYDYIKPNLKEWQIYVDSMRSEDEAIEKLIRDGTKGIVVTLGSQGVRYINEKLESKIVSPSLQVNPIDVTGAGDSVAAALSLIIINNAILTSDLEYLNQIGGETVSKIRTEL